MLQKQTKGTKGQGVELFKLELFLALPFEGEWLSSSFALLPSVNPIPVFRGRILTPPPTLSPLRSADLRSGALVG